MEILVELLEIVSVKEVDESVSNITVVLSVSRNTYIFIIFTLMSHGK